MRVGEDDFRRRYSELSDEGLLSIDRKGLLDAAKHCYDDELARRRLAVEDPIKEALLQKLWKALNQSIRDSKETAASLEELKQAGYKVSLTVEAAIRFEDQGGEGNGEPVSTAQLELPSEDQH